MTVAEIREKLLEFPQDMVVCLKDWSEGYMWPRVQPAERMEVVRGKYIYSEFAATDIIGDADDGNEGEYEGDFLQIG